MKVFRDWDNNKTGSFVIFLGNEARNHCRRMRSLYNDYIKSGDIEALKQYTVQCGSAMQTKSLFVIAKYHFEFDTFKRKYANKKSL
jgi:hypothetical protein